MCMCFCHIQIGMYANVYCKIIQKVLPILTIIQVVTMLNSKKSYNILLVIQLIFWQQVWPKDQSMDEHR